MSDDGQGAGKRVVATRGEIVRAWLKLVGLLVGLFAFGLLIFVLRRQIGH